ncbi:putative abl interactor 2 isoform X2 [Apostichopus japonicus]|uniref:Putative abl interactor 2 isoform X2 n=1 Tax=Stichopus japonicus TaxID=307972 RepID=A0A2G8KFS2_STIJA|nr:putative abl interactor 2 isoform X2 [Apostichopus japonicus]
MMSTLEDLLVNEIPTGRQALIDSHNNLPQVASYCEENYEKAANKRQALEETKNYVTQSLASVAYQINTLATSMLNMLDLQATQLSNMETNINHIAQTVSIHKEKVARREIGVLTTSKSCPRTHKIVAPSNQEKQQKYKSTPIDYSILDDMGHGTKLSPSHYDSMSRRKPMGAPPPAPLPPGGYTSARHDSQTSLQSSQNSPLPQSKDRPPSQISNMGAPPPPSMTPNMAGMTMSNNAPPPPSMTQDSTSPMPHMGAPPPPTPPPAQQFVGTPPPPAADEPPPPAQSPFSSQLNQALHMRGGAGDIGSPDSQVELPPPPVDYEQEDFMAPPPPVDDTMPPPPEFLQTDEPSWVPGSFVEKVIAIFDYEATRDDELTFAEGSLIYVLQKNPDGWYEGVMNGYTGLFPGNYVELCP